MPKHIDRLDQARIALAASLAARPIAGGTPLPPGPEPVRPPPSFQDGARFFLSEAGPSLPDQKFPTEKSDFHSADNTLHHTLCGINRGLACSCRGVGFRDALVQKQWEAWNAGRTGQALNSTAIWGPAPFGAVVPLEPEGTMERLVEDGNLLAKGTERYRVTDPTERYVVCGCFRTAHPLFDQCPELSRRRNAAFGAREANMQRADEPVGGPTARYATCGCLETAHPLFRCPELRARGLVGAGPEVPILAVIEKLCDEVARLRAERQHPLMLVHRPGETHKFDLAVEVAQSIPKLLLPGLRTIRSEYVEMPKGFAGFPEWNNRLPLFDAPTPYPGLKQVEPLQMVAGHTFAGVGSDEKCECGRYWHGIWGVTREDIGKPNIAHSGDLNEREYDQIQVKKARDDARWTVTF